MRTTVLAAAACVAVLSGCGNKGDLYLPGEAATALPGAVVTDSSEDDPNRKPDEDQP
ncbi:MAG: lipoprotein [Pseudomonadota bacterium]